MSDRAPDLVTPAVPKGFRDSSPGEVLLRNELIDRVRKVFECYGFSPLETPAVERLDVLLGKYGAEGNRSIFRFETADEEAVGLRFDLTVPLARYVAQNRQSLPMPFRRYQVSPVWRFDKPGPGRFREFRQFDIDTVGSSSLAADVEILSAMLAAFAALGLERAVFRVSSRGILNTLVRFAGIPEERGPEVFRVLDKLDKQGLAAVRAELGTGRVDSSGAEIPGLGFGAEPIARIERFLGLAGAGREETLARLTALFAGVPGAVEAVAELAEMDVQLTALGHGDDRVLFDVALARGLDYYTGPIFESVLPDAPEFGSVFGGGRYDGLVERFLGEKLPGTGGSLGVDRLLDALIHLGTLKVRRSTVQAIVTVLDPALMAEYQRLVSELRGAGIRSEIYLGDKRNLKKQLAYADKIGASVALLLGGNELEAGEVSVKNLVEGAGRGADLEDREEYLKKRFGQKTVKREDLVATVLELVSGEA